MAATNSLKMVEVCQVTPLINSLTPDVEFLLPLTHFDLMWLKFFHGRRVFWYQLGEHDSTQTFFNSVILPQLKHSLSLTLTHYFPAAGHIICPAGTENPYVLYTPNGGVSLTVVESDSDFFHRLILNEMQEAVALLPYTAELPVFDSKDAITAFKITFFPGKGFSVAIANHHAMFDGKSVAMFMRSWAHICKENSDKTTNLLPSELTPFFYRSGVHEPQGMSMFVLNNMRNPYPGNIKHPPVVWDTTSIVRATYELSQRDITNLRQKIVSHLDNEGKDSKDLHLSTFVVSYGYIIESMVKAKQLEGKAKVGYIFGANCRSRLNPPLPMNYVGNCIVRCCGLINVETILETNGAASIAYELSKR